MARKPEAGSRKKGDRRPKTEDRGPKAAGSRKPAARKPARGKKPAARKQKVPVPGFRLPAAVPKTAPYSEGKWAEAFEPRKPGERRYWLVKSEPAVFSFDDLLRAPDRTTYWDGVRNFAARNFLRDGMKLGDRVFFYHSMADPQHIAGICEVVREGYPDDTALDSKHPHHDPESNPDAPQWYMVDLRAVAQFTRPVTLPEIKARKELADMALLRIGRLSVTPVRESEWKLIVELAG
jgi:predicted RNA-binding protein with PUA-like domain